MKRTYMDILSEWQEYLSLRECLGNLRRIIRIPMHLILQANECEQGLFQANLKGSLVR